MIVELELMVKKDTDNEVTIHKVILKSSLATLYEKLSNRLCKFDTCDVKRDDRDPETKCHMSNFYYA